MWSTTITAAPEHQDAESDEDDSVAEEGEEEAGNSSCHHDVVQDAAGVGVSEGDCGSDTSEDEDEDESVDETGSSNGDEEGAEDADVGAPNGKQVAPADLVALDRTCFTTSSAQRAALRERLKVDIKDLKEQLCMATLAADDPLLQV